MGLVSRMWSSCSDGPWIVKSYAYKSPMSSSSKESHSCIFIIIAIFIDFGYYFIFY